MLNLQGQKCAFDSVEQENAEDVSRQVFILQHNCGFSVSHKSDGHRHETHGHKTSSQHEDQAEGHDREGTAECCRSSDERALLF